jgi:hypothetical protein
MTRRIILLVAALGAGLALSTGSAAAITGAQQASKAQGQASFFCFAWQCRKYVRTGAAFAGTTLVTRWHLYNPSVFGHPNCRTYADMMINVTRGGAVSSRLLRCG